MSLVQHPKPIRLSDLYSTEALSIGTAIPRDTERQWFERYFRFSELAATMRHPICTF